jgi:transmembrane sensor
MKDSGNDRFKNSVKRKMEDKAIHTDRDAQIWKNVLKEVKPDPKAIYKTEYPWYAIAAAVLLFVCFGLGLFYYNNSTKGSTIGRNFKEAEEKTVQKIDLPQQEIKNNSGSENISKKEPVNEKKSAVAKSTGPSRSDFKNKVVNNNDEILQHRLKDGSLVTLNSGSNIKMDDSFKNQRDLRLQGEAYFEVQPDKKNPFTVFFSDYKLVVVGTKFNIRNFKNEKIKEITVTEGVVRVFDNKEKNGIKVKKGEQLRLEEGKEPVLMNVETTNYIAWKTGDLDFKKARLEEVTTILSRTFEKEIVLANQIKNCKFTGDLSGLNLNEALEIIRSSTSLKIEKSNNKLYVTGSGCD